MESKVSFKDRLVWTLVSTAAAAVAASLAQRLAGWGWQRATHRAPPKGIRALGPAGSKAGKGAAGFLLHRFPPARALRG